MDERATGLILRLRPVTETSLVVHWLTADQGRLSTIAKGARRPSSPFRGKLDLFYRVEFSFHRSRRGDLHTLREARLVDSTASVRTDLARLQQAAYASALLQKATESDTPLPEFYALFRGFLNHLQAGPAQPLTIFAFETRLLAELGLAPDLSQSSLSAGARAILARLATLEWQHLSQLKLARAQTAEIQVFLQRFLLERLEGLPRGREAALDYSA